MHKNIFYSNNYIHIFALPTNLRLYSLQRVNNKKYKK